MSYLPTTCWADTQLCSLVSRASGEQPIGSAPRYGALLVLSVPRPWPRNAFSASGLPGEVQAVLAAFGRSEGVYSLLAVEPEPAYSAADAPPEAVRALHFHRPEGLFTAFERREWLVPEGRLAAFLSALLLEGDAAAFADHLQQGDAVRDLLVCTHEARDICCGRFGEAAYRTLRHIHPRPGVRVWRTSHIGGYKFAPTLLDLPSGRFWGHLEPQSYAGILDETLEPDELRRSYRGWSALGKLEQVAERAAFLREGWGWAELPKTGRIVSADVDKVTVELEFRRPNGAHGRYRAVVRATGEVETLASSGDPKRVTVKQYGTAQLTLLE